MDLHHRSLPPNTVEVEREREREEDPFLTNGHDRSLVHGTGEGPIDYR